ncbi:MAG TPA: hypothetical protein VFT43_14840 [Candidatus Polarisedimenticolia bacterium]|nr:hypothetical protein [Candidatus Polarisedimenticolia bacterium]
MIRRQRLAVPALLLATGALVAGAVTTPAHAAVVERFSSDPLADRSHVPFFAEGNVGARFKWIGDEPSHFPGDPDGTLRVLYDTTLPAGRIATPLDRVLSLDEDFGFGAILTIRSAGLHADPDGFSQIAFGLWNAATTGIDRTGWPSDSFDLVELDYFPNVGPFGGPFLTPSVAGGNVGGNAFLNFAFASVEKMLPLDEPILCQLRYTAANRLLTLTASRRTRGVEFAPIPGTAVSVDLSRLDPTFLVNVVGIAGYFEGFASLSATVDYDLLYFGDLPAPFGVGARSASPQ